ncbi:hypothetical protein [Homoserinibacter sp. GY 40078]|uniref:hypothetical protein n=1 Tax=Homoserinibacter sp. GY 40078 TaxID=2603275 RepID=UPI0011C81852|nr:hypothetical protein [Homoserinibacter sp. GY 40078]TXK17428.1 hypothetical protein FVQ89_11390 [Homoserinibacter sp. GY 40078]
MSEADAWLAFSRAADILTVLAAAIAILGVLAAWLSRPRLTIHPFVDQSGLTVSIINSRGSRPAYNLDWVWEGLNDLGEARHGTGEPWQNSLHPGEGRTLYLYAVNTNLDHEADARDVTLPQLVPDEGALVVFRWRHPVLTWVRAWVMLRWTRTAREASKPPEVLRGMAAWCAYRTAHKYERKTRKG